MYLTDIHIGVTYCRVDVRSLDTPVNMSLCPSSPSNGPLGTGVYSVEVYDIESDGGVSSVPALAGEMVTVYGPSTAYGSSSLYGPSVVYGQTTKYGLSSVYSKPISYIYSWNKGWVQYANQNS